MIGDKTPEAAAAFLDLVIDRLAEEGITVSGILTDPAVVVLDARGRSPLQVLNIHRSNHAA